MNIRNQPNESLLMDDWTRENGLSWDEHLPAESAFQKRRGEPNHTSTDPESMSPSGDIEETDDDNDETDEALEAFYKEGLDHDAWIAGVLARRLHEKGVLPGDPDDDMWLTSYVDDMPFIIEYNEAVKNAQAGAETAEAEGTAEAAPDAGAEFDVDYCPVISSDPADVGAPVGEVAAAPTISAEGAGTVGPDSGGLSGPDFGSNFGGDFGSFGGDFGGFGGP